MPSRRPEALEADALEAGAIEEAAIGADALAEVDPVTDGEAGGTASAAGPGSAAGTADAFSLGPSLPVRIWHGVGRAAHAVFGMISLVVALAVVSAIPLVQFISLGYLLEASGRVARTGRFREGIIGLGPAARAGSLVLGSWLLLWPLRFLSDLWYNAQLIAPRSGPATALRIVLLVLTVLFVANVILAWFAGGKLRHFFWPLLAPIFFGMWLLRKLVARFGRSSLVRPLLAAISPRLLGDLTRVPALNEWFPPAVFWSNWRRGELQPRARDAVWEFAVGLRLPYYFSLGLRGFLGAVAWLLIPAVLMIGVTRVPAILGELGAGGGAVQLFTVLSALAGFVGAICMAVVVLYLPFLQAHFAAENRLSAMFELSTVRRWFRQAPVAYWLALFITFLFALPLFLLKIEYTLRELLWIPSLVFVILIYPARLLTGWALARAKRRETPRFFLFRYGARLLELPVVGFYVFVLFFTQYTSWMGSWSLLEQPAFLLPAPFFIGM